MSSVSCFPARCEDLRRFADLENMPEVSKQHDKTSAQAAWSDPQLVELARKYSLCQAFQPDEVIFSEGDLGDTMLLILRGEVRVLKHGTRQSDTTEIAKRCAGDFLGEMALVDESHRFATVVATTECEVLVFTRPNFEKVIREQPALAVEVLRSLSGKLRESDSSRIHELEQSNARLSESNRKLVHLNLFLDCVIDESPSAIVLTDPSGKITRLNGAACKMFAVERSDPALRINDLIPSLCIDDFFHDTCVTWQGEANGRREGEIFPVFLSVAAVSGPSDSVLNLHILQDITDLKMLSQTTTDIEKYEAAQRTVIELAHDVKNYLGVLLGSMELIIMRLTPEQKEKCQRSINAIEATSNEIVQFLEGIMIYRDAQSTASDVNLANLVKALVKFCGSQSRFRDIKLRYQVDARFPKTVRLKEDEMRRVLINLMVNAVEAMEQAPPDTRPEISIELGLSPDSLSVIIRVQDNGPGISEDNLPRLFKERFTTKADGHGIGLVSLQRIVQDHKGKIEAASQLGQGTTFTIQLPIAGEAGDA